MTLLLGIVGGFIVGNVVGYLLAEERSFRAFAHELKNYRLVPVDQTVKKQRDEKLRTRSREEALATLHEDMKNK